MEEGNNFKQLYEEEEYTYRENHQHKIRANIWGTLGLFRLVGDLIDVFLPSVMNVFVMASGGRKDNNGDSPVRGGSTPPGSPQPPDPARLAPGAPDEGKQD